MAPIGEQLRATREQKGLSLERIADETNIAKRYLSALEAEDFSVFPGDPYAIGFLRNYAEYLGLPSDDLVASFKNLKIQEQPVPINDLIPKRGPSAVTIIAIAGGGLLVLVIALLLVLGGRKSPGVVTAGEHHAPIEYRLDHSPFEKRLYLGDSLLVTSGTETYKILVSSINDAVTLDTPAGPSRLMLGEEGTIDLDRNNQPELKVLVTDLSRKDPSKGALLHFEYSSAAAALKASSEAPLATDAPAAGSGQAPVAPAPAPVAAAPIPIPAGSKSVVLFESGKSPYPFVVSVTFRGSCMFRYEVDRRDRDERYYRKGETISENANNSVKLWASNGQSAKLTVQASGGKSADIDLGGPGEVSVKRIAWSQTDSGTWTLSAIDVD
jgi:cytoskeletal protein RodZ